jgi:hypothetical protein
MRRSCFFQLLFLFQSFISASEPNTETNVQSITENSASVIQEESFRQRELLRRELFFGNQALLFRPDILLVLAMECSPFTSQPRHQ